jgi:hypothetical protein
MPRRMRLTGLPEGAVDKERNEIQFSLATSEMKPLDFVAKYGIAAQVVSGIGRMMSELRAVQQQSGATESPPAEMVTGAVVRQERDVVLLQLMTQLGIPYTFAIPAAHAAELAERLRGGSGGGEGTSDG